MSDNNNVLELSFNIDDLQTGKKSFAPRAKKEYLEQGTAFYRILPSFDTVDRRLSYEYYAHWLAGEDGKKMRALCTRSTEGYCPLCEASNEQKSQAQRATVNGGDPTRVKLLEDAGRNLSASKSVYFNAVNVANEVVVLELNATTVGLLVKKLQEAIGKGFDPLSPTSGVWFRFTKNGKGRDAFEVDFKKIAVAIDGEMLEKNDRTPLSDDLISRMPSLVTDLSKTENLYIQTFTSKELSDFLRGTPLKSKYQKKVRTEQAETTTNTDDAPTTNVGPSMTVSASQVATPPAKAPTSSPATQVTGNSTPGITSAAAEVARLRSLSKIK